MNGSTFLCRQMGVACVTIVSCAVLSLGMLGNAYAEDATADILKRLEKIEREAGNNSLVKKLGLSLYGYVEASYTQNFKNPSSGANQMRSFDGDSNSFRPNMAQVVLEREAKSGGSMADRAGFRVKLDFGEDAKFTGGTTGFAGDPGEDFDFQEAFVQFIAPIGNGLTFQGGRMNTLIGYEVIESPFNPNFSRSFLFGMGEPFTVTGLRSSYDFSENIHFAVSAINSFTGAQVDTNSSKSVEALLAFSPMENVGMSVFGFWGPEGSRGQSNADQVLFGGIFDVQVTEQAQVVVEGYYANQAHATGPGTPNSRWNGAAGYFIYDFTDKWGVRVRGEIFEDAGGTRSCAGGTAPGNGLGNALLCFAGFSGPQTLWESTWTLMYKPVPSLMTRLEFRYDKSDQNSFQNGVNAANNQQTLAVDAIFLF